MEDSDFEEIVDDAIVDVLLPSPSPFHLDLILVDWGPPASGCSPFRAGRCGCVGEVPPCREGLGAVRATDSYSIRGCWLVAHECAHNNSIALRARLV